MTSFFNTGTILLAFLVYALGRYFLVPLFREWPGDQPESVRLRRLASASEFMKFFKLVFKTMPSLRHIPHADRVSPQLTEKLMLAVCGVNECSHCSYLHSQTALEKGIPEDQIQELLSGQFGSASAEELPALLYAQHYAETRAEVSETVRSKVVLEYGENKVLHMDAYLLTVFFGNLCCNTVQYYEHGRMEDTKRHALYLVYLLAKPVQWFILRSGARLEHKRAGMTGGK